MLANLLLGHVGGGWALEIETFLCPVKWHRAVRRACHLGPKKLRFLGLNPIPLAQVIDLPASKALRTGTVFVHELPGPSAINFFYCMDPWIRIHIEIKSWIQIHIETNADPQHGAAEKRFPKIDPQHCFNA